MDWYKLKDRGCSLFSPCDRWHVWQPKDHAQFQFINDVIRKHSTRAKQRRFFSRAVDGRVSQPDRDSPGSEAR